MLTMAIPDVEISAVHSRLIYSPDGTKMWGLKDGEFEGIELV